jgi:hypothetical protein
MDGCSLNAVAQASGYTSFGHLDANQVRPLVGAVDAGVVLPFVPEVVGDTCKRPDHVDAESCGITDAAVVFDAINADLVTDLSVVPDPPYELSGDGAGVAG